MKRMTAKERKVGIAAATMMMLAAVAVSAAVYKPVEDMPDECYQEPADTYEECDIENCVQIVLKAQGDAISEVESGCDSTAYNASTGAAGDKQLRKIMVREANRILGRDEYSYDDRYSARKSQEIFEVVISHHNPQLDIDSTISIWNPGCGRDYRERVRNIYYENLNAMM